MIRDMATVWLYAFSPRVGDGAKIYHTVYTGRLLGSSRAIFATVSLSYLVSVGGGGAGALIKNFRNVHGALFESVDFAQNSVFVPDAISITFGLSANGGEAYAQGTLLYFN